VVDGTTLALTDARGSTQECVSGEHQRLGAITGHGDTQLHTLLIHGSRSTLHRAARGKHSTDGPSACAGGARTMAPQ
jgi:hypothetical protein